MAGGSKLVLGASEKVTTLLSGIHRSSALIAEIAEATGAQAQTLGEISDAVRVLDEMTQHNGTLVEHTNATIAQSRRQADTLDAIVADMTIEAPSAPHLVRPVRAAS